MLYTTVVDDTSLEADGLENQGSRHGQYMRLAAIVNFDSRNTVSLA
jgi:hypothetical protein